MSELFKIEESLSPRMKWIRAMGVKTHHAPHFDGDPWCAWHWENDVRNDIPNDMDACGYGETEAEAIDDLANKLRVVQWEVKGGKP